MIWKMSGWRIISIPSTIPMMKPQEIRKRQVINARTYAAEKIITAKTIGCAVVPARTIAPGNSATNLWASWIRINAAAAWTSIDSFDSAILLIL